MRSTLTFAAIGAGLAATLVFGAQMGLMVGLMVFLVGNNALLTKDLDRLKAHLDKVLNELPTLVSDLVKQRLNEHDASSPPKESIPAPEVSDPPAREPEVGSAVPALEQRISSLDSKLETLIFQLSSTQAPASPHQATVAPSPPMQVAPAAPAMPSVAALPESRLMPPAPPVPISQVFPVQGGSPASSATEPVAEPAPSLMDALRQDASAPGEHVSATAELAAMRELMLLMTSMLSQNAQMGKLPSQVDRSAHAPSMSPAPAPAAAPVQAVSVEPALDPGTKKPSIDRLRAELDKLAQELRTELDRPKR